MIKYDVYAFGNGRVTLIDSKILSEAIENDKEILIVCNAWSGGYAYATGANKIVDPEGTERCSSCGKDVEEWIETEFSFCDEYGCGMALCKDCAEKLKNEIEKLLE